MAAGEDGVERIGFDRRVADDLQKLLVAPDVVFVRGDVEIAGDQVPALEDRVGEPGLELVEKAQLVLELRVDLGVRLVAAGRGDQVAIRWLGRDGRRELLTFDWLASMSARFANVLESLGVGPGERVVMVTGRIPELYVAVLGTLRHRAVSCTLFSAFGPEPIRQRLALGDARVLVTTEAIHRRKIAGIRIRGGVRRDRGRGREAAMREDDARVSGREIRHLLPP